MVSPVHRKWTNEKSAHKSSQDCLAELKIKVFSRGLIAEKSINVVPAGLGGEQCEYLP